MQLSVAAANVAANAICALLTNGYCRFYTAPRPASSETALTTQTLLAQPRFNSSAAFGNASNAVAVANAFTQDASTPAGGTIGWARLYKADGVTVVADCSVGVGDLDLSTDDGFDIEVSTLTIAAGRRFGVSGMNYTQPR